MKYYWLFFFLTIVNFLNAQFRVTPYLLSPSDNGMRLTWLADEHLPSLLTYVVKGQKDSIQLEIKGRWIKSLQYSELEESERADFPDMFNNASYKYTYLFRGLEAETTYAYSVQLGRERFSAEFSTAPPTGKKTAVHFITFADSETDPAGRQIYRSWSPGTQHPKSSGRPDSLKNYLLTETEGYKANLGFIKKEQPDFLLLSGDIVQGGGYQRAWDEFFFHNAGKFDTPLATIPFLPAMGNWENFGARNGGYEPWAIAASRAKYQAYFDTPANNNPDYQNYYYRIDYGPVTILTLDSSNGLPDSTDADTNVNINLSTYPGRDLPDINPGSDQWEWTIAQLKDAREKGQLIFVQFHHIPYSSGGHSLPLTAKNSSGQAGIPMRVYTPEFKKYGVIAVFCGHNESLEHSIVDGIHFWDIGIAGDGMGYSIDDIDPRRHNPYRQFVAHRDAPEFWKGKKLVDGGKHYGYLKVDVTPRGEKYSIKMTPYIVFPKTNKKGEVVKIVKRKYDHVIREERSY